MIYKYKTKGKSLKDFSNYQNVMYFFIHLIEGNVNPGEVLKNQINFKSDLGEIKKENPKSKSADQISALLNIQNVFDLWGKVFLFF